MQTHTNPVATADTSQLIDPWALLWATLLISARGRTERQGDCRSERGIDDAVLNVQGWRGRVDRDQKGRLISQMSRRHGEQTHTKGETCSATCTCLHWLLPKRRATPPAADENIWYSIVRQQIPPPRKVTLTRGTSENNGSQGKMRDRSREEGDHGCVCMFMHRVYCFLSHHCSEEKSCWFDLRKQQHSVMKWWHSNLGATGRCQLFSTGQIWFWIEF